MAIKSGYTAEDLARLGPDALTRKRMLAEALLGDATKQRKIENPLQGLAQMADALVSGLRIRKMDAAEQAGQKSGDSAWSQLFGGAGSSTGSTSMPSPQAANEISATTPAPKINISGSADASELNSILGDDSRRATLPAGMRNNNPGNIKFVGQKIPGIVGPSTNTDQGDPQAVFDTPESGMRAMYQLLGKKYAGGKLTPNQIIAGNMGWTPGNYQAASNVASYAGIGPDDDIGFNDPNKAAKFMRALMMQEHGKSSSLYPDSMILSSIGAAPAQVASLDPKAGMAAAAPQVASVPPAAAAPQAAPQSAPQPQQLAQALMNPQAPQSDTGPSLQALSAVLSNPWVSDDRKKIAQALLGQRLDRQNSEYEQWLKQSDPVYQQNLQKGALEIENLQHPKMSPSEQANLDLNKQKFAFEQDQATKMTPAQQAENSLARDKLALDREKFDAEMKKGQWQKLTDGRLYNETTGEFRDAPPPVPGSQPVKFDDISGLRKEIQQLPSYKNLSQALPIYKSMAETAGRNSKASDLNLVYGLGKIMDPNSVVREGEMVMVKNTASIPDWLQGAIASLNGGAALSPETRQAIMTEAFGRTKGYSDAFEQDAGQYRGIVKRNNLNEADVIPQFEQYAPWKAAEQPKSIGMDWQEITPGVRIRKVQ